VEQEGGNGSASLGFFCSSLSLDPSPNLSLTPSRFYSPFSSLAMSTVYWLCQSPRLLSSMDNSLQGSMTPPAPTTLDESISATIFRDLRAVGLKLKIVLLPGGFSREGIQSYEADTVLKELKEWDLWGPLLVCLLLSVLLSTTAGDQGSLMFSSVFVIVWFGSAVVTLNAVLLGGCISYFQSVSVLGYCLFPLSISAILVTLFRTLSKSNIIVELFT